MMISLLAYLATFSGQLYFQRSYFFTLLQSNCFGKTVTLSEQLFPQRSCFFEELRFRESPFFAAVIFTEFLIFRKETSTEQPLLENRTFFRAVTFRNSHFFGSGIAQNKNIYRRAPLSKQTLLHNISFFRRATSSKKLIFQIKNITYSTFSEELPFLEGPLFQKTLPSITATFSEELLSNKILFFQKNCYFTATLPLHSHTYYLSVSNEVSSVRVTYT